MSKTKREHWSRHFGKWFRHVLMDAEIVDYRYPIKGMTVWRAYGFRIRRNALNIIRNLLDQTGHQEMLFPLLIPETSLAKESVHMKNFEAEVFWITRGGLTPLDIKLALRPTSETVIAPMLKLWIRSHADLPIKLYQVVNTFRYETRATRPLIRVREIDNFNEAHTVHATAEEAEAQVKAAVEIYKQFFDTLCVPYVISLRPDWDKFAGAVYTISFEQVMPDGRTLQIGTVHNLGQNFSKAFGVTYETGKSDQEYVWQTCYGLSGRPIAGMLAAHGDDNGAVLPPQIAPTQVVVIPIPQKEMTELINKTCQIIIDKLKKAEIRAEPDFRSDLTPGSKFYHWELRGVPVRIEVGPRDIEQKEVTVVRRDTFERQSIKMDRLVASTKELMKTMTEEMRQKAWDWMNKHICRIGNLEKATSLLRRRAGIVEVPWCGKAECGRKLEEDVGARVLGTPVNFKEAVKEKCVVCGNEAETIMRVANAY